MQLTVHGKNRHGHALRKHTLLAALVFFAPLIFYGQEFSFSFKKTPLHTAFREIEAKTQYRFVFTREEIQDAEPVTLRVSSHSIDTVLGRLLAGSMLGYSINKKYVSIHKKEERKTNAPTGEGITVKGRVRNESGEALANATVLAMGGAMATATDENGLFELKGIKENSVLLISSIGYKSVEVALNGRTNIEVRLGVAVSMLDETVIIAYGTTTKRLNTGSVSKVSAEEIGKQPVANPIAALEGRVPGLVITQSSGYSGSAFTIRLRGQNSLAQGSNPLFIIDGVPFAAGNNALNQINNATELSPFYTINPADIESIEVLKDADATAIYGSRGANGVILITTKKGKAGKTKLNFTTYSGWSRVTRAMEMLTTRQYVAMRREAQRNDGTEPTKANSPDIMVWDTTRFTNFKKMLIGGTARTNDIYLSLAGGQGQTQFSIGSGYHRESTVLPTDLADSRASAHFSLNHSLPNKKLSLSLKSIYSISKIKLPTRDPGAIITMPPNMRLFDSAGKLNWEEGGVLLKNIGFGPDVHPLAVLQTKYEAEYQNLSNSLQIELQIVKGLQLNSYTLQHRLILMMPYCPMPILVPKTKKDGLQSHSLIIQKLWAGENWLY
jgi:TonB-dependent starch-binding outer membrane protein SusC